MFVIRNKSFVFVCNIVLAIAHLAVFGLRFHHRYYQFSSFPRSGTGHFFHAATAVHPPHASYPGWSGNSRQRMLLDTRFSPEHAFCFLSFSVSHPLTEETRREFLGYFERFRMNNCYFLCHFEENDWRMRALIHANDYLLLYEIEPEDKMLLARFGIKFITQPRKGSLDVRCSNQVLEHRQYEQAVLTGLKEYLVAKRFHS